MLYLQVVAKEKVDLMVQLVGYPDWLLDNAELDKYYEGVSVWIPFKIGGATNHCSYPLVILGADSRF